MLWKNFCMLLMVSLCLAAAGCGQKTESAAPAPADAQSIETAQSSEVPESEDVSAAPEPDAQPSPTPEPDAVVNLTTDENGAECVSISCQVPGKSTIRISNGQQELFSYTNPYRTENVNTITIPIVHFLPSEPTDGSFMIEPEITITTADGVSYPVAFEPVVYGLMRLELVILSPVPDENGIVMAAEDNTIVFTGTVSDPEAQVTAKGFVLQVGEDGAFEFSFEFPEDAPENAAETILFEATKYSCVSARLEITVHAYRPPTEQ